MNTGIPLIQMKTSKTHLAGEFPFQFDFEIQKMQLKIIILILSHFSRNPIRMPPRFTQISLESWDECVLGLIIHFTRNPIITTPSRFGLKSLICMNKCVLGPQVVPDEPGRPAGPAWLSPAGPPGLLAGWPCLAGRWAAWLARLASWLARSGRQEEECRPPAPITAGGLFGI